MNPDSFFAWSFPVPAVNPFRSNHLYVAYADKGENSNDNADVFLTYSTDGGVTWTNRQRVNTFWTNDQWMPVLAAKPDGTKLFMAWYDRRGDTINGLMEVYGRWGTIETNGALTLDDEFRISTVSFPPVYSGADTNNQATGHYDPVYPPRGVNLQWWYPEWPPDEDASDAWRSHVGEYNGVFATEAGIVFSWTDGRIRRSPISNRHQRHRQCAQCRVCSVDDNQCQRSEQLDAAADESGRPVWHDQIYQWRQRD